MLDCILQSGTGFGCVNLCFLRRCLLLLFFGLVLWLFAPPETFKRERRISHTRRMDRNKREAMGR